jgi:hypothetical protein
MDNFDEIADALLLPDLDDDCNPIELTAAQRQEAIGLAIKHSLDYCYTCNTYMVPGCHNCDGPNRVIWP